MAWGTLNARVRPAPADPRARGLPQRPEAPPASPRAPPDLGQREVHGPLRRTTATSHPTVVTRASGRLQCATFLEQPPNELGGELSVRTGPVRRSRGAGTSVAPAAAPSGPRATLPDCLTALGPKSPHRALALAQAHRTEASPPAHPSSPPPFSRARALSRVLVAPGGGGTEAAEGGPDGWGGASREPRLRTRPRRLSRPLPASGSSGGGGRLSNPAAEVDSVRLTSDPPTRGAPAIMAFGGTRGLMQRWEPVLGAVALFLMLLSAAAAQEPSGAACSQNTNRTCEECLKNVSCLWCHTNKACVDYPVSRVLPPSSLCQLSSARWGVCWVNFEALIITLSVVGGAILLAVAVCCACCCCGRRRSRKPDKGEEKAAREREERRIRQEERRAEMKSRHDEIRKKYGLFKEENPYARFENN
ncbi:pituitary tumor-transforming gene 1 protein-interacting protein [Ursus americanus]|nr:pituitary tumor-transforming gene 1 protein-interacting protein [Ursus americanus]